MRKIYTSYVQRPLLLLLLAVVTVPFSLLSGVLPVSAATSRYDSLDIAQKIKAYEYYTVFKNCATRDDISDADIASYKYFDTSFGKPLTVNVGYVTAPNNKGLVNCDNSSTKAALLDALTVFNLSNSNPGEVLCSLGYTQNSAKSNLTKTSCSNGTYGSNDNFHANNSKTTILNALKSKVFGGNDPVWSDAMAYYSTFSDFMTGCSPVPGTGANSSSKIAVINTVAADGKITTNQSYTYTNSDIRTPGGDIGSSLSNGYIGCVGLVQGFMVGDLTQKYVKAYQAYIYELSCQAKYSNSSDAAACIAGSKNRTDINYCTANYKDIAASYTSNFNPAQDNKTKRMACYAGQGNAGADGCIAIGSSPLSACIDGAQHSTDPAYCTVTYPEPDVPNKADTNKAARNACTQGQTMPADTLGVVAPAFSTNCAPNSTDPSCVAAAGTTCTIEGIGWIVCPVLGFMGTITDSAFNFLATNFLQTNSSIVSDPATVNAWGVMRSIANVAFVIAFLIIIFSQLSSVGITNYGVKKMLPRLVIAAILVNMSFIICQIAVDISNILGYSLKNLFDGLQTYTQTPGAAGQNATGNGFGIAVIIAGVLAGGVGLALAVTIPVLLSALLALMLIVLILFGRTALIILLVIISPLAFVAYLLPNTEQWFKKWFKMFSSLLLVFPIIAVVFGASSLAAGILKAAAGTDLMLQVVAMGVATVPLFVVPGLLKGSLSAAGALGTQLAGLSSKANGKIGGKVRETSRLGEIMKNRQANSLQNRANRRTQAHQGFRSGGWKSLGLSGIQRGLDNSKLGRSLGFDKGAARAINTVNSADNEEVDASERLMKYGVDPRNMMGHAADQLTQANATGDSVKARAATKILLNQGAPGVRRLHTTLAAAEATPSGMHRNVSGDLRKMLLESGIKARDNALGQWSFDTAARSISDITSGRGTGGGNAVTGLTPVELAGHEAELLRHWGNNGLVTIDQANRTVAAVASGNISMDDTKLAVFQAISTGAAMPAPPTGTSPTIY